MKLSSKNLVMEENSSENRPKNSYPETNRGYSFAISRKERRPFQGRHEIKETTIKLFEAYEPGLLDIESCMESYS